jgi:phosphoribosylformimino-5-aminoimidazole carboxamide ribotide isomerase
MLIFPAIDIKDGRCVRLRKGDYATAQQVAPDALQTAKAFESAGAKWLHMVDLNGAKDATRSMQNWSFKSYEILA